MHERRTPKKVRQARAVKRGAQVPAELPVQARPGYRKGDPHSGGGGHIGGGKKRRPPTGWEKGDFARDVDTHHDAQLVPVRPRRDEARKAEVNATRRARRRGRKP